MRLMALAQAAYEKRYERESRETPDQFKRFDDLSPEEQGVWWSVALAVLAANRLYKPKRSARDGFN